VQGGPPALCLSRGYIRRRTRQASGRPR